MEELKPCPFCGASVSLRNPAELQYYFFCDNYKCNAKTKFEVCSIDYAVKLWNTRAESKPRLADLLRVEKRQYDKDGNRII